jgi:hypothetical protein
MSKQTIKLAEALLRRKELQGKVDVLKQIKDKDMFEVKASRKKVTEDLDDVVAAVPKLTASQFTAEYDWHAKQLRLIDAAIQQTNWTAEITIDHDVMAEYSDRTAAPKTPA